MQDVPLRYTSSSDQLGFYAPIWYFISVPSPALSITFICNLVKCIPNFYFLLAIMVALGTCSCHPTVGQPRSCPICRWETSNLNGNTKLESKPIEDEYILFAWFALASVARLSVSSHLHSELLYVTAISIPPTLSPSYSTPPLSLSPLPLSLTPTSILSATIAVTAQDNTPQLSTKLRAYFR